MRKEFLVTNPVIYSCVSCNKIYESISTSVKPKINITACGNCQTLTGGIGDMRIKNIDKFKERLEKKMSNKKI